MKLEQSLYSVSDLIDLAQNGKLSLPEFQRPYVWPPAETAELLRTIARKWPAGTFLMLRLGRRRLFEMKSLQGAPDLRSPELMILDGQQRMTSFYRAITGTAEETFYLQIRDVVKHRGFDEEFLRWEKSSRFVDKYPGPKEEVEAGLVSLPRLWDDEGFSEWVKFADERLQPRYWDARKNLVPGLNGYDVPCVVIPPKVELAAIAKIFEDINRRGKPLKPVHLMVAKLYPHGFKLRNKSRASLNRNKLARAFFGEDGDEVFGMEVLKLIALREYRRQQKAKRKPLKVRGVRESDVLDLEPRVVKSAWSASVRDYVAALRFVQERCGVVRPALLPARAMLLPLAHALSLSSTRGTWKRDLERWFWASAFDQTYAQGANTQATTDASDLVAWSESGAAPPDTVANFTGALLDELLLESRPRNEMLVRGILCLLVKHNCLDWIDTDERIGDTQDLLQVHHVFSRGYMGRKGDAEEDLVVNFAVIKSSTNASIRDESPSHVAGRRDVSKAAVESHRIPWRPFKEAKWGPFKTERAEALKSLIAETVLGPKAV